MVPAKVIRKMRRLFFVCMALVAVITIQASAVNFTISNGIDNVVVKSRIENSVSQILSEINAAQASGRSLNFAAMGVGTSVQQSMAMLWENTPFICTDEEIIEHCLTTGTGYQVRNIPLMMKPTGEREFNEDEYQEAVISFDRQGNVESFYLSISMNLYMNVIKSNLELTDLRRRQMILDYVEQFRTAYNQKDINFLNQVFSEDALIITGKVIKQTKDGMRLPDKITYAKQTKTQYLTNLKGAFSRNKTIRVTFDEIEVMRHKANKDFYGVTLHQGWTSDCYHDDGYIFLLWDFRNENQPKIHVRTWQPDAYNSDGKGTKRIPKDEIFSLSDFDI